MNQWVAGVMESWVAYHVTRCEAVLLAGMVILLLRGQMMDNVDMAEMLKSQDDMCQVKASQKSSAVQAIALWDIKMAKETRSTLNTLLFHYIVLEDILLTASGSVEEQPRDCTALSMYC